MHLAAAHILHSRQSSFLEGTVSPGITSRQSTLALYCRYYVDDREYLEDFVEPLHQGIDPSSLAG